MSRSVSLAMAALLAMPAAALVSGCSQSPTQSSPLVSRIDFNVSNPTLAVGDTLRIVASAYDESGTLLTNQTVSWASAHPTIATVDGTGLLTGVAAGNTTVYASAGGASASTGVTVHAPAAAAPR